MSEPGRVDSPPKIVQVLMHDVVREALADMLARRGLAKLVRQPMFDEGEIEAWQVVPVMSAPARTQSDGAS